MNGMSCDVCGYDCGRSIFWWTLELKFWWHEVRGGKAHRAAQEQWYADNLWRFQ